MNSDTSTRIAVDQVRATVVKDLRLWARDRQAMVAPMLLPIVLMFIATVLFGFGGDQWNIALVNNSDGPRAASFVQEVKESHSDITPYFNIVTTDAAEGARLVSEGRLQLMVTIPGDFDRAIAAGHTPTLKTRTYNINTDMMKNARLRLERVLQDWGTTRGLSPITIDQVTTRTHDVWRRSFIGGSAVILAIMVGAALNTAIMIAREWEHDTHKEIQLAPKARVTLITGKLIAGIISGALVTAVTLTLAITLFGLRIPFERIPLLILYAGLTALASAAVGLAIGAWLRDYRAVQPLLLVTLAGSFFASGGFSSVPTLPPAARAIDRWWPVAHVFETLNNYAHMAQVPTHGSSLVGFALAALAATAIGARVASRRL